MTKPDRKASGVRVAVLDRRGMRVGVRDCRVCGYPFRCAMRGRAKRYCSAACRQRNWALEQAKRTLSTGSDPRPEHEPAETSIPVEDETLPGQKPEGTPEEVTDHERRYVQRKVRCLQEQAEGPSKALDWQALLRVLGTQLRNPKSQVSREREHHDRLHDLLEDVLGELERDIHRGSSTGGV